MAPEECIPPEALDKSGSVLKCQKIHKAVKDVLLRAGKIDGPAVGEWNQKTGDEGEDQTKAQQ